MPTIIAPISFRSSIISPLLTSRCLAGSYTSTDPACWHARAFMPTYTHIWVHCTRVHALTTTDGTANYRTQHLAYSIHCALYIVDLTTSYVPCSYTVYAYTAYTYCIAFCLCLSVYRPCVMYYTLYSTPYIMSRGLCLSYFVHNL